MVRWNHFLRERERERESEGERARAQIYIFVGGLSRMIPTLSLTLSGRCSLYMNPLLPVPFSAYAVRFTSRWCMAVCASVFEVRFVARGCVALPALCFLRQRVTAPTTASPSSSTCFSNLALPASYLEGRVREGRG